MILVMAFVRDFFAGDLLPEQLAGAAVITEHHELKRFAWRFGAGRTAFLATAGMPCLSHCGFYNGAGGLFARRNGRKNENAVAPDNRSGGAGTRHASLPANVF